MWTGIRGIMEAGDSGKPEILAPAGDTDCFLAALAAGANGIYLGLKNFSARMEAENFGLSELCSLVALAHENDCRIYVAMNNMIRQQELNQAYRLVRRLTQQVGPDGLIVQDLAMLGITRQAGFDGLVALSTLANVCDPAGLEPALRQGANRVILPRELSVDEMRAMGEACPPGLELECFVHGALCYCVSGRCYWSSYMGGKSGLRGRCVQPCRRVYSKIQKGSPKPAGRLFACQDLELLPAIRALFSVPHLVSWKIEGRKKGPHYVYHAVTAYRILRDFADDPQQRRMAQQILEMALGRPGVRARFLPQKKYQPMAPHGQTSSGLLAGKITIRQDGSCCIRPHIDLLPKDYLRIGSEDEKWHTTLPVARHTPGGSSLLLNVPKHKTPRAGTPVYLIDRREPELAAILKRWRSKLEEIPKKQIVDVSGDIMLPVPRALARRPDLFVDGAPGPGKWQGSEKLGKGAMRCFWLSARSAEVSRTLLEKIYFWLPPAIWPDDEPGISRLIARLWHSGARHFVCNSPWQRGFFPQDLQKGADLVAGPFCNLANTVAIQEIAEMGFSAAFVSTELSGKELLTLPAISPLPLGIVLGGYWPVGMSRFGLAGMEAGEMVFSPKGEGFWAKDRAGMSWIYPAWQLDISTKRKELEDAGYSFFAWLEEKPGAGVKLQKRPGLFNWEGALL